MRNSRTFHIAVIAAFLSLTVFAGVLEAQTIRATGYIGNESYQLNEKLFSYYPLTGGSANIGCVELRFVAEVSLHNSAAKHTFTAVLKRDGVAVQTATTKFGPWFTQQNVIVTFQPMSFTPGTWTIEWAFQISAQQSGTASIALVAPIQASTQTDQLYQYCNRNATINAASYSNYMCHYAPTPPTGFIFQNGYYRNAVATTSCSLGIYDGANCLVMNKPATGFIFQNAFYRKYNACSRGTNDGANCFLGGAPGGTFVWNGAYYYSSPGGGQCPYLTGSTYDGAHCRIASAAAGFLWNFNFYLKYDACSAGTNDGANCRLAAAPWGTTAFEYQGGFYTSTTKACLSGTYDGAHCYVGKPPVGATAFAQSGYWRWTPRYCQ